jgi:dihydroxy-acid dehydratase
VASASAVGGPIALLRNGDIIQIDARKGTLKVKLSAKELRDRRKGWSGPRETIYGSGALWKYAQLVGPTQQGAVTHPGQVGERHVYADL